MVEFNNSPEADQSDLAWDFINNAGGTKSITFAHKDEFGQTIHEPVGTSYTGVVTEPPVKRQVLNFDTKMPEFWPDGNPKFQIVVKTQTDYRDPADPEDDGIRSFFLRAQSLQALQDEMRRLGLKKFEVGTRITQTLIGLKPTKPGMNPQKIYKIDLVPATSNAQVDALLATQLGATPVVQQPVQQPVVQQAPVQAAPAQAPAPTVDPVAALLAQAQATQQAPVQATIPIVTDQHTNEVGLLIGAGIDRASAIGAVAQKHHAGDESFRQALDNTIPF